MGSLSKTITTLGITDSIVLNEGGPLNDLNVTLQVAAATSGYMNMKNPVGAGWAIGAGEVALGTGAAALAKSIQEYNDDQAAGRDLALDRMQIESHAMEVGGDALTVLGALASQIPDERAEVASKAIDGLGATLTGMGIAVDVSSLSIQSQYSLSNLVSGEIASAFTQLGKVASGIQQISTAVQTVGSFLNGLQNVATVLTGGYVNSSAQIDSNLNATELSLDALSSQLNVEKRNISTTSANNFVTLSSEDDPSLTAIGNFNISEATASGNAVSSSDTTIGTAAGTQDVSINANNITTDIYGPGAQRTNENVAYRTGASTFTTYSTNPADAWLAQTIAYSDTGRQLGSVLVNKDATSVVTRVDPESGQPYYIETRGADGQVTGTFTSTDISFTQVVGAIADTLATRLISKVLHNNLPATVAVQALADATIQSAIAGVLPGQTADFVQDFTNSVFGIAGGIGGSEVGGALAKAMGLPSVVGQLPGGVVGNLVTQAIVKSVASNVGIGDAINGVFTGVKFGQAFAAAGAAWAGSEIVNMITPTTEVGAITGAVYTAAVDAALLYFQPEIAAIDLFLATFGADVLGTLIGDIFGNSHPSVGPNAATVIGIRPNTTSFIVGPSNADNGGDVAPTRDLASKEVQITNALLQLAGGQVTTPGTSGIVNGVGLTTLNGASAQHTLGYYKGQWFYAPGNQYGHDGVLQFSDANALLAYSVIHTMKSLAISGGDPNVKAAIQRSTATNLNDFLADVQSAADLSTEAKNPEAWNLRIATSADPVADFLLWASEQKRVEAMNLPINTTASATTLGAIGVGTNFTAAGTEDVVMSDGSGKLMVFEGPKNAISTLIATGTSNTLNLSGHWLGLMPNIALAINGRDEIIEGSFGDNLTLKGPAGAVATVDLALGKINLQSGMTLNYSGTSTTVNVAPGGGRVNLLAKAWGTTLSGNNVAIYADTSYTRVNFVVNGLNDSVYATNAQFTIAPGKSATIYGSKNQVTLGNGSTATGTGNVFGMASGLAATVNGTNTVNLGTNNTLTSYGATVYMPANTMGTFFGGGNAINVGASDVIRANHDQINIGGGRVTETIRGGDNNILAPAGTTLVLSNDGNSTRNIVNTGGSTIYADTGANILVVGQNDSIVMRGTALVAASSCTFHIDSNVTGTIAGGGDAIFGGTGDKLTIQNVGTLPDDVVHVTSGTVHLLASSHATVISTSTYVNGDGNDRITAGPGNWGSTFTAPNSIITIDTSQNAGQDVINSSGDTINASRATLWFTAGQNDILNGQGNVVTLADNVTIRDLQYGNAFKVANNDTLIVSTDTIDVGAGRTLHVAGQGNVINGTSGDYIDISNPGNAPTDIVHMNGGTVHLQKSSRATLSGASDIFKGDGDNDISLVRAWGTTINAPNSRIYIDSSANRVNPTINSSGDTVYASNTDLWVAASQSVTLSGTGNNVNLGANDNILDLGHGNDIRTGLNDVVSVSADTIEVGANNSVRVNGWGNGINATSGDYITISNPNGNPTDNVRIHNGTVKVLDNSRADIYGDNNIICVGNGAQVTVHGVNDQVVHDPVIVQFGSGAVETTSLATSSVYADVLGNGTAVHTAWMTAGEGMLVYDPANTNEATAATLITGYDQLRSLDANLDGVLDARDAAWDGLKLLCGDPNGTSAGTLETLGQAGLTQIDLRTTAANANDQGNVIFETGHVTWADGHATEAAAVGLQMELPAAPAEAVSSSYVNPADLFHGAAPEVAAPAFADTDAFALLGPSAGFANDRAASWGAHESAAQLFAAPSAPLTDLHEPVPARLII